ncbi:hypothetical protein INS49_006455 [Diaporthe citri]|uniref:uncharacterized protein n=1 Tax=Diaporthe citri TaxID=83186 RepID=UPI001C7F8AA2|nr:uncharacterized protein INS49_006455 [Diaporthe citri]KAG6364851.1 hypothetical protein INS49_006455 [Diaporthe citri]
MTSKIAVWAAKQAAGDTLNNFAKNFDSEDPFYYYDPHQASGELSEKKKKKKGRKFKNYKNGLMGSKMYQAPGVSAHDNNILASVRRRSWHLDMSLFHWCGFRFGWSVIIGLVPVLGDIVDCLLAWWIIRKADKIEGGLPSSLKSRMYLNVAADFAIGLVPLLGDIADALYKANSRNTWLLEDYLVKKAAAEQNPQQLRHSDDPEQGLAAARPSAPQPPKPTKKMKGTRR